MCEVVEHQSCAWHEAINVFCLIPRSWPLVNIPKHVFHFVPSISAQRSATFALRLTFNPAGYLRFRTQSVRSWHKNIHRENASVGLLC